MRGFNKNQPWLDFMGDYEKIEDWYPTTSEIATIQGGDIIRLGNHVLMCGDSATATHITALMDGLKADLIISDPPYGMKKEKDGVLNDNLNYADLLKFNKKWMNVCFKNLKENGSFYCFGTDEPLMDIYGHIIKPMIRNQKATFRNLITWEKSGGTNGILSDLQRMYAPIDEKILFVMAGTQGFNNNKDNYFEGFEPIRTYLADSRLAMGWDVSTMKRICGHKSMRDHWTSKSQWELLTEKNYTKLKAESERQREQRNIKNDAFTKEYTEIKADYEEVKKEFLKTRAYFNNTHEKMTNVWHFGRTTTEERAETGGHKTPKPIALLERIIKSSSKEGDVILDPFGGSGSTLIACERTGRRCLMMELSPKWCEVIKRRYERYNKQIACA